MRRKNTALNTWDSGSGQPDQPYQDQFNWLGDNFFDTSKTNVSGFKFTQLLQNTTTGSEFGAMAQTSNTLYRKTVHSGDLLGSKASGFGISQMRATETSSLGLGQTFHDFKAELVRREKQEQQPFLPQHQEENKRVLGLMEKFIKKTVKQKQKKAEEVQNKKTKEEGRSKHRRDRKSPSSPRRRSPDAVRKQKTRRVDGSSPESAHKRQSR